MREMRLERPGDLHSHAGGERHTQAGCVVAEPFLIA